MGELHDRLAALRERARRQPPGFMTSPDLVFDDDEIDGQLTRGTGRQPTPANVIELLVRQSEVPADAYPAVISILSNGENAEQLDELCAGGRMTAAELWTIVKECMAGDRLQLIGIGLAFASDRHGLLESARSIWRDLGGLYVGVQDFAEVGPKAAKRWHEREESIRTAVVRGATGFWTRSHDDALRVGVQRILKSLAERSDQPAASADAQFGSAFGLCLPGLLRAAAAGELSAKLRGFAEGVAALECVAGSEHPYMSLMLNVVAVGLCRGVGGEISVPLEREALRIARRSLTDPHYDLAMYRTNIGAQLFLSGRLEEAYEALSAVLALTPTLANVHYWHAKLLEQRGRPEDREAEARAWRDYLRLERNWLERRNEAQTRLRQLASQAASSAGAS